MSDLTDWLDTREFIGPARYYRTARRLGGSQATVPDRPRLIVIHTMETPEDAGRARSTALWVQTSGGGPDRMVSTHFCVDNAEAIRCVEDAQVAFTQGTPWNDMGLSIEQAGRAGSTAAEWQDAYSVAQRRLTARLVAAWCERWRIPPTLLDAETMADTWRTCTGVTTHAEVARASRMPQMTSLGYTPGDHWDPGPYYPMDMLLAEVRTLLTVAPPDPPPVTTTAEDTSMYVTNSEARSLAGVPGSGPGGTWLPGSVVYSIDAGMIRNVRPAEDAARKAENKPVTPVTNEFLNDQIAYTRDLRAANGWAQVPIV